MRHRQLLVGESLRKPGPPLSSTLSKIIAPGRKVAETSGRRRWRKNAEQRLGERFDRRYSHHCPRATPWKKGELHHRTNCDERRRTAEEVWTKIRTAAPLTTVKGQHRVTQGRCNNEPTTSCAEMRLPRLSCLLPYFPLGIQAHMRRGGGVVTVKSRGRKNYRLVTIWGVLRTKVSPDGRHKRRPDDGGPGRKAHTLSPG